MAQSKLSDCTESAEKLRLPYDIHFVNLPPVFFDLIMNQQCAAELLREAADALSSSAGPSRLW